MSRDESLALIHRFVETRLPEEAWYRQILPDLKAIIFYGSRAKETNRPDSDIDLLLIVPLAAEQAHTQGEYVFEFEGCEINIVLRSIEKMRRIAEEMTDVFQREVFRNCEIIWSLDPEVPELLTKISNISD